MSEAAPRVVPTGSTMLAWDEDGRNQSVNKQSNSIIEAKRDFQIRFIDDFINA